MPRHSGSRSPSQFAPQWQAYQELTRLCLRYAVLGVGGQEARHGCAFDIFFSHAIGTTPQELIQAGIYNGIAIGLKGGPWRRASLMVVAKSLAKHAAAVGQEDELTSRIRSACSPAFARIDDATPFRSSTIAARMWSGVSSPWLRPVASDWAFERTSWARVVNRSICMFEISNLDVRG